MDGGLGTVHASVTVMSVHRPFRLRQSGSQSSRTLRPIPSHQSSVTSGGGSVAAVRLQLHIGYVPLCAFLRRLKGDDQSPGPVVSKLEVGGSPCVRNSSRPCPLGSCTQHSVFTPDPGTGSWNASTLRYRRARCYRITHPHPYCQWYAFTRIRRSVLTYTS